MEQTKHTIGETKARAASIFQSMGFTLETDKPFAEYSVDIFLSRSKFFGKRCECWSCFFFDGGEKVSREMLDRLYPISEAIQEEIYRHSSCCDIPQTLIVSGAGFTKAALEAAEIYDMVLKTPKELDNDLQAFYTHYGQLVSKSA